MAVNQRVGPVVDHLAFAAIILGLFYLAHFAVPATIPTPGDIVGAFQEQLANGAIVEATTKALYAIAVGYAISVAIGISVGIAMGVNWHSEQLLEPYVNALYVVPVTALVPAFIIWFGTGFQIRVFVIVLFATFPILINTFEGVKSVPPGLVEATRSFGAGSVYVIRNVVIPHEIPYITAGLRLGIGRAVKALVITELIVSVSGFGRIISRWSAANALEGVFSVVFVLMALGVLSTWLVALIERRIVHWDVGEN